MPPWNTIRNIGGMAALLMPILGLAQGPEAPPGVTPYRPTVSNPAELSAPGWLEIETGWAKTTDGDLSRRTVPYLAKIAFSEDWGMMLGGDLRVRDNASGLPMTGRGDTSLAIKHRLATGDETLNFGIEAGIKFPTAPTPLGSGKRDWTINGIVSKDFPGDWRLDANLGMTGLGAHDADQGTHVAQWAAALSRPLGSWTLAGEISGTRQRGTPNTRQWLLAAAYAITPRLVVDAGIAHGRSPGAHPSSVFVGFSWLVGRLF